METSLLVLTFGLAHITWVSADRGWVKTQKFAKPATLMALIAWFSLAKGWQDANLWFGLGLVFSLLGDVLFFLPDRYFVSAVAAFLAAQVLYVVGFNQSPLNFQPLAWVVLALVGIIWLIIFSVIRNGMVRTPEGRKLLLPIVIYSLAISLMLASAWLCLFRPAWPLEASILAGMGALSFVASDSMLTYARFVKEFPHHDLLVLVTYYLGQIGIIAGVILLP